MSTMQRFGSILVHCLAALSCALPVGCMLPYAYPHLSHVAGVDVDREAAEVHAFRVDASVKKVDIGFDTDEYRLGRIPLGADGRVPPTTRVDLDYGMYVVGMAVNYPVHYGHHTETRLYRRGFKLIEVESDAKPGPLDWKPARGLPAQERAVDDLLSLPRLRDRLSPPSPAAKEQPWSTTGLSPGSAAPAQRDALLFAAGEYERLAALTEAVDARTRERLIHKAREIRACADR